VPLDVRHDAPPPTPALEVVLARHASGREGELPVRR
jgi:hypothetical protein